MISDGFVWAIVWLLVIAGSVFVAQWAVIRYRHKPNLDPVDRTMLVFLSRALTILALIAVLGFAIGLWPYQWQYHSYQPVAGTVLDAHSRFITDGDSTSQSFAIRLSNGRTYRCDDTRCAAVMVGDRLRLRCIREWVYAGEDGYVCRFVRHDRAAS